MRRKKVKVSSPIYQHESLLDVPLECQDPEEYGNLDEEQIFLLKNNALDLVLIENAAELLRRVMMSKDNIERVLTLLSNTYEGCGVLPSESFPMYSSKPHLQSLNTGTENQYKKAVSNMRKKYLKLIERKDVKCVFAVFGLIVDPDGGGHYGSFYVNVTTGRVMMFDSMQMTEQGSSYSDHFQGLAVDIFGTNEIYYDSDWRPETSLQLTGGFSQNDSLMVRLYPTKFNRLEKKFINIQSTESQNHFCYMWSIWSIHLRMLNMEPHNVAIKIRERGVDPLTVIKRYSWALFNFPALNFIEQIPKRYQNFFKYHWPSIWSNDPLRKFVPNLFFSRYSIPLDFCQDISSCAHLSYGELKVITEQNRMKLTEQTNEVINCARHAAESE